MIDLRSDTFTRPTPAMRRAIADAEVGDDCFGEDPTVRRLEQKAAELLGKERALFFPSGIMANQAAILSQAAPGEEVVADAQAHLIHYEEGSIAAHGGLLLRGIPAADGVLSPDELAVGLRPSSPYHPRTTLLALENTHLDSGGRAMSFQRTEALAGVGRERGLAVHLDGARLWNAASALACSPAELAAPADTVMTSLSKGLGAPVGSMLAGPGEVLGRAWRIRRRLGGQMRQAGLLAAAGLHALEHHLPRLGEDHRRARRLAKGIREGAGLDASEPETNVVMVELAGTGVASPDLLAALRARGVLLVPFGATRLRAVLHLDVDDGDVEAAIGAFEEAARALRG